ncbi:MAG: transglutaminaseTgpA domain-containing protein [Bacteriovoracia bacterium]
MTIGQISLWLTRGLDALALHALAGTDEISPWLFFGLAGVAFARWAWLRSAARWPGLSSRRLNDRWWLFFLPVILLVTVGLGTRAHLHPILLAAYVAPVIHAMLWFLSNTPRNKNWRLGIGFIELVLATSLTPDLYLGAILFVYVVLGSLMITCNFLERELGEWAPPMLDRPSPPGFLSHGVFIAVLVFFISILIFPVLPRTNQSFSFPFPGSSAVQEGKVGYTDSVDLSNWTRLSGEGGGVAAVRLFIPSRYAADTSRIWLATRYLRGKTLNHFDGNRWSSKYNRKNFWKGRNIAGPVAAGWSLEFIREPIDNPVIPAPYGSRYLEMNYNSNFQVLSRHHDGSWFSPGSARKRLQYQVHVSTTIRENTTVSEVDLSVPEALRAPGSVWPKLAKRIFGGATGTAEKISLLREYFIREKFVGSGDQSNLTTAENNRGVANLEEFLLRKKAGHCEMFASASTLLLRLAGVPTRLVAGFRSGRPPLGDVIVYRTGDGHAWVEYWDRETGWRPYDPTPQRVDFQRNAWDLVQETQEYLAAYWNKYVVSFDAGEQKQAGEMAWSVLWGGIQDLSPFGSKGSPSEASEPPAFDDKDHSLSFELALVVVCLIGLGVILVRNFRRWTPRGRGFRRTRSVDRGDLRELRKRRARLARLREKCGKADEQATRGHAAWRDWYALDERLRFGPDEPDSQAWRQMLEAMDRLWVERETQWKEILLEKAV